MTDRHLLQYSSSECETSEDEEESEEETEDEEESEYDEEKPKEQAKVHEKQQSIGYTVHIGHNSTRNYCKTHCRETAEFN